MAEAMVYPNECSDVFDGLVLWMRNEGLITFDDRGDEVFYGAQLTSRAFGFLGKSSPDVPQPTIIAGIKSAAGSAASEAGRATIQAVVTSLLFQMGIAR